MVDSLSSLELSLDPFTVIALTVLFFAAALLYATVGHAGASGYLATMGLLGVAPQVMKPTALTLNVVVALIGTIKFYRAGCFRGSLFWPFAVTSIPLAFLGGRLTLPAGIYLQVVGAVLWYAAFRLFRSASASALPIVIRPCPLPVALLAGGIIGLLSGLTGVGGGIFLSPLLLMMGWAEPREAAGVSAAFILVNSAAGLLGNPSSLATLPPAIGLWAVVVALGGWMGAEYGSRRFANQILRRLLATVLVIAGIKLLLARH